ncbi:GNAT family N-acetyltransferase [Parasphingorhabdus sp.]|uniref:GNAT family N-acetyltransferase n=1 Tax=Parasphingorhabdus sp. TaxID=2709688 RepID=UPI003265003C
MRKDETAAAARQHRSAGALIPGFVPTLHSLDETYKFYNEAYGKGTIWGAFEEQKLLGHIALEPGWIEHLYVDVDRQGEGIGRRLLDHAKGEQTDLQLYTFQANQRARAFYEAAGFVMEEMTNGERNEEKQPDMRYRWKSKDHE